MPSDACQFFYGCRGCGQRLKPKPGDCCVFCSYGSVPCPPIQRGDGAAFPPKFWEFVPNNPLERFLQAIEVERPRTMQSRVPLLPPLT